jgi:hypothetical protein
MNTENRNENCQVGGTAAIGPATSPEQKYIARIEAACRDLALTQAERGQG